MIKIQTQTKEKNKVEEDLYLDHNSLSDKEKRVLPKQLDLGSFIESKVRMEKFRNFDLKVGVDGAQFIGLPGSGKTSFAMLICKDLIKDRGENILMSGDRFCEFRHFFRYPRFVKKIYLFLPLPEIQTLHFHNIPHVENKPIDYAISKKYGIPFESIFVDYETFNINEYIKEDLTSTVFAIYDQHFQGKFLYKRAELWKRITKQLLERVELLDVAITTLFNEAGILFQEGASGKHWKEINEYSEIVVENRKGLVRPIYLSQLETEMVHTIRKKMLWKCYRLGTTSAKGVPLAVQRAAPFQSRSAYILMYGNLFSIGNQVPKLSELSETWKIIPIGEPNIVEDNGKSKEYAKREEIIQILSAYGKKQGEIADLIGVSQPRINQILQEN